MKAFRVVADGQPMGDFGVPDVGVSHVSIVILRSPNSGLFEYTFSVGGMTEPDDAKVCWHYRWACPEIREGSRLEIEIVESANCIAPTRRYRSDHEVQEPAFTQDELRALRHADYLELKKEFEP